MAALHHKMTARVPPQRHARHLWLLLCCIVLAFFVLLFTATYDSTFRPTEIEPRSEERRLSTTGGSWMPIIFRWQRRRPLQESQSFYSDNGSNKNLRGVLWDPAIKTKDPAIPDANDVRVVESTTWDPTFKPQGPPISDGNDVRVEESTTPSMSTKYANGYAKPYHFVRPKFTPSPAELKERFRIGFDVFQQDQLVTIRGFFSSGTNWLRTLINRNCPNMVFERPLPSPFSPRTSLDADGVYGWKHGLFLDKEIQMMKTAPRHKMIIIVREAPTWVISAWKMAALVDETNALRYGKHPILTQYLDNIALTKTYIPDGEYFEALYDKDSVEQYRIKADNPLRSRDEVQKNWISLLKDPELRDRVAFVRYEDLFSNTQNKMSVLASTLGLDCPLVNSQMFDPVVLRVKYGTVDRHVSPRQNHHRYEFCYQVTTQEIYSMILSKIDLDFESSVLGYTYPATLEEYCREPNVQITAQRLAAAQAYGRLMANQMGPQYQIPTPRDMPVVVQPKAIVGP